MKKFIFILLIIFSLALIAQAQTEPTCEEKLQTANQRVNKVLADLTAAEGTISSKNDEIAALKDALKTSKELSAQYLQIIKDYATTPVAERKSFWKKVGDKLAKLLDAVTDPETLVRITTLILLIKTAK